MRSDFSYFRDYVENIYDGRVLTLGAVTNVTRGVK